MVAEICRIFLTVNETMSIGEEKEKKIPFDFLATRDVTALHVLSRSAGNVYSNNFHARFCLIEYQSAKVVNEMLRNLIGSFKIIFFSACFDHCHSLKLTPL